jgi:hypothetical protein
METVSPTLQSLISSTKGLHFADPFLLESAPPDNSFRLLGHFLSPKPPKLSWVRKFMSHTWQLVLPFDVVTIPSTGQLLFTVSDESQVTFLMGNDPCFINGALLIVKPWLLDLTFDEVDFGSITSSISSLITQPTRDIDAFFDVPGETPSNQMKDNSLVPAQSSFTKSLADFLVDSGSQPLFSAALGLGWAMSLFPSGCDTWLPHQCILKYLPSVVLHIFRLCVWALMHIFWFFWIWVWAFPLFLGHLFHFPLLTGSLRGIFWAML